MKKQKKGFQFLKIVFVVLIVVTFFMPKDFDRRYVAGFAVVGIIGSLLTFLVPLLPQFPSLPKFNWHQRTASKKFGSEPVTDTETLLWRQISYQITGKLQSAYPDATWDFIKRPNIHYLLNGKDIRIRTSNTGSFNFAEIHMDQYGSLTLQMMTIEALTPHKTDGNENAPQVDPESWYTLIGKPVLTNLVGELQARGYQKLFINEQGEIYILKGKNPEIKATLEHFPPKAYWPALTDIFIRDELKVDETDQALELSWVA